MLLTIVFTQLSQCFYHQLLLFPLADLFSVCLKVGFLLFQDIPKCCISYAQSLRNCSDILFQNGLLFSRRQLSGLNVGLSLSPTNAVFID